MNVENRDNKFLVITSDEGMVLTEWTEDKDIMEYSGTKKQFSPLTYDITELREITDAEHSALIKEQEVEIKKRYERESESDQGE